MKEFTEIPWSFGQMSYNMIINPLVCDIGLVCILDLSGIVSD